MNVLFRFLFILAYFSFQLAFADQSTRERIAVQKKWLEQRDARKRQLMQTRLSSNLTDDQWWSEYYRYYRHDLNKMAPNRTKSQRKPTKLDIRLKSKRKKQQQFETSSMIPNDVLDISTSTTTSTAATLPMNSFVTVESTTAGITKSTDELQPNYGNTNTTSEINSSTQINDRMSLNESSTNSINEISTTTPTTTATTEHSITYNVTVNNSKRVQTVRKLKSRKLSNAIWGRWLRWTKCSRSCGGFVMSQSRQCLSRDTTLKNRTSNECIGLQKRYRICNEQSCPEQELDFRDQQCIFYNNQSFHGETYSWESCVVDEAECELNCKPVGMNYFATLKDRVIDGTSCLFPIDFVRQNHSGRAMCVEGICKILWCNRLLFEP